MIEPLPSLDRTDPLFRPDVDLFFATRLPAFSVQAEAARVEINAAEVATVDAANQAVTSAASAANASAVALGAANFKGIWENLTGSLNKPASVKHNGRFWLLLNNLANVAASEPGATDDWTSLDAGQVSARITTDTNAVPGVYYIAAEPGITLSVVDGEWAADDTIGGRNVSGDTCFIAWGTHTLCDDTPQSPMRWPSLGKFNAVSDGSTFA